MSDIFTGGCLCGAVRFRITGTFDAFFLCHCMRCRRATGSAHAANLFPGTARIAWQSGAERVRRFRLPGTGHGKTFCATCGAGLPSAEADGTVTMVPAGCLDGPVGLAPDSHLCWADRADWDDGFAGVPRLDGLPG